MNRASFVGIFLGIAAVLGGHIMEGGRTASILQPTAAFIVFGGTFGAVLLSFPLSDVGKALASLREIFLGKKTDSRKVLADIMRYSGLVRKKGILALEIEIPRINDRFLQKALVIALDHMNVKYLREAMEQELRTYETEKRRIAKVYETAGGFAPTIGIIGAVLGLIHVMENLSDPSRLGSGIAVAFVATVYGVGSANLILLPISRKLINMLNHELYMREMMLEGVVGIQTGLNPHHLMERLSGFLEEGEKRP